MRFWHSSWLQLAPAGVVSGKFGRLQTPIPHSSPILAMVVTMASLLSPPVLCDVVARFFKWMSSRFRTHQNVGELARWSESSRAECHYDGYRSWIRGRKPETCTYLVLTYVYVLYGDIWVLSYWIQADFSVFQISKWCTTIFYIVFVLDRTNYAFTFPGH